jgi:hypothetical protein
VAPSIKRWNTLNKSYLKYNQSNKNLCLLRYEDLVLDPTEEVGKISRKYKIHFEKQKFISITNRVHTGLREVPFYSDDELKFDNPFTFYHDKLSEKDISQINSNVDLALMEDFNYSIL